MTSLYTLLRTKTIKSLSIFFILMSSTQVWGKDVETKNVGFEPFEGPTPISPECLNPQEVFNATTILHVGSAVEPTIAVNPKNKNRIVMAWQQDRISTGGGSLDAGIAFSENGGKSWKRTTVPFQICQGGISQRVTDVWLSYAPDGETVYLTAVVLNATEDINTQNQRGTVVTLSKDDGKTWSFPHFLAASQAFINEPTGQFPEDVKSSVTADRNDSNFAYVVWDRFPTSISFHSTTQISRTTNGGVSWSPHALVYDPFPDLTAHAQSNGIENDNGTFANVIVVLPEGFNSNSSQSDDSSSSSSSSSSLSALAKAVTVFKNPIPSGGDLLNFMSRFYAKPGASDQQFMNDNFPYQFTLFDIAVVRSQDRGLTFDTSATVIAPVIPQLPVVFTGGYTYGVGGNITGGVGVKLRTGANTPGANIGAFVPAYNVNPNNGFLYVVWQTGQFRADQLPQIALSTSRDGGFNWSAPVMINRTPQNARNPQAFTPFVAITQEGKVGILYSDFRNDSKTDPLNNTLTDTWLAVYTEVIDPNGGSTGVGLDFSGEFRLSQNSYIAQNGPSTEQGVMTNGDYSFLDAQDSNFYAAFTQSQPGPFSPTTIFLNDPTNNAVLLLDNNFRQSPFFSLIKP